MDYLVCKELYHHGIKGQKWGIRKYQNEDGTLTAEGKARYGYDETTGKLSKEGRKVEKSDRKEALKDAIKMQKDIKKEYGGIFGTSERDRSNIKQETNKIVREKYGNKTVKDLSSHNTKVGLTVASGLTAAHLAVSLAWVMGKSYE